MKYNAHALSYAIIFAIITLSITKDFSIILTNGLLGFIVGDIIKKNNIKESNAA
ncbi:hypothetical protein [Alkalicoccus daliensis]|uniref:Uncharacterized protein n=1 Tax=Alkalicoccus daliensis TaxID=745820 RepID=A0A1H0D6J3_9BACI|nr:hypothetical protein [Alkalicoccus daliensis]SDN65709.1 hypothetical protein SAMN04488053_102360 [Alkalicoccus daliensis]